MTSEDILAFWFPPGLDADEATHRRHYERWFRGGGDAAILARFRPVLEAACRGELHSWAETLRERLALIIVLDQFSRTVWRDTPQAFAQDSRAQELTLEGLARGEYEQLATVWEKTFFVLPLGHAEQLDLLERCVALCEALVPEAPPHLQPIYRFSASQARGHRDVVARFAASHTETPCSAGFPPRRSSPTSPPASWCTGAPFRADTLDIAIGAPAS
jgi:uncharacterized protein (DUF924 family)